MEGFGWNLIHICQLNELGAHFFVSMTRPIFSVSWFQINDHEIFWVFLLISHFYAIMINFNCKNLFGKTSSFVSFLKYFQKNRSSSYQTCPNGVEYLSNLSEITCKLSILLFFFSVSHYLAFRNFQNLQSAERCNSTANRAVKIGCWPRFRQKRFCPAAGALRKKGMCSFLATHFTHL